MHHFFVTPQQISGDKIRIEGGDVNHMKNVLRMKLHEKAEISDGESRTYLCEVEAYEEDVAVLHILEEMEADTEPASKLYLFQGLPKSDKMELIVQKAVELGVYQVIPVAMKRSVVRLDDKKAAKKADRWNSIAESAAKQAGRSRIPEVTMPLSYKEALKMAEELDVTLFPYELAGGMEVTREVIRQIKSGQSVGIFIGPEVYSGEKLNKPLLANYLFATEENAARINSIVHPCVKRDFLRRANDTDNLLT